MQVQCKMKGCFWQDGDKYDMEFDNCTMDQDGNIQGSGTDDIGDFTFGGRWDDSEMEFTKQYIGAHAVYYRGPLNDKGTKCEGKWEIPGDCGGDQKLKLKAKRWKGSFEQDDEKYDMEFCLEIAGTGVYGMGKDNIGKFWIQGYANEETQLISFKKQYYGAHAVYYHGAILGTWDSDEKRKVKGAWTIPGDCYGHFELKEKWL